MPVADERSLCSFARLISQATPPRSSYSAAGGRPGAVEAVHRRFPPDIDAATGLCADGRVRVAASPGKGLGAFAAASLAAGDALGFYSGEAIGLSELLTRYGDAAADPSSDLGAWERQHEWRERRRARGVGATGKYVYNAGASPETGRLVFLDAEDLAVSNWTRFVNHSADRPALEARVDWVVGPKDGGGGAEACGGAVATPRVVFVVARGASPGEELHFDYGGSFFSPGDFVL